MCGWIKLNRSIQTHWIYNERRKFSKLEAWVDILMTVNFAENKVLVKGKIYEVKRGESINSMDTWAKRWSWDKSAVRRFLNLLQNDNMISVASDSITTHLTVCKYDSYQGEQNTNDTHMKHRRNADEFQTTPIEERKKEEERKEGKNISDIFDFKKSLIDYGFNLDLVNDWLKVRKTKKATNTQTAYNEFINQVEKSNIDKNEILKLCVSKDWRGFNVKWLENISEITINQIKSATEKTYRDKINEDLEKKAQLIEVKKEEIDVPEY